MRQIAMRPCPKCKDVGLRAPQTATPVLRCYKCHGMWLTMDEAAHLAESGGVLDPVSMLPQKNQGDHLNGLCPFGDGLLTRAKVELDDPFYVERCVRCGGMWFDSGEWQKLGDAHLIQHIRELWDPVFQRNFRRARTEQRHRARLEKELGADLLGRLEAVAKEIDQHPSRSDGIAHFLRLVRAFNDPTT